MLEMATLAVTKNGNIDPNSVVRVHFNPQTLSVSYSNRGPSSSTTNTDENDQANTSDSQSTGYSSSLSVELLFDTTETGQDVWSQTQRIVNMMQAENESPRVRFLWGHFLFYGRIESVNQTLDYWSETGIPLRATVSLSLSSDQLDTVDTGAGFGISASLGASASAGIGLSASASIGAGVGTQSLTLAQSGDSMQSVAARAGVDWKAAANLNNIENPRLMQTGNVLNMNIKR